MARSYARLAAAIWDDPEFRALPADAQLTYVMLVSQREISMCGVLTVAIHRWAGFTTAATTKSVERALKALHDARFVVLDLEAGEVLVRTFAKHNDVWKSANTAKAAARAFGAIHSAAIRNKVNGQVPPAIRHLWPEALPHTPAKVLKDLLCPGDTEDPGPLPPVDPTEAPPEGAYEGASVAPTQAPHRSLPDTRNLIPEESSSDSAKGPKPQENRPDGDDDMNPSLGAIAAERVARRSSPPDDRWAYTDAVARDLRLNRLAEIRVWLAEDPSLSAAQLADRLWPAPAAPLAVAGPCSAPGHWEFDGDGNAIEFVTDPAEPATNGTPFTLEPFGAAS